MIKKTQFTYIKVTCLSILLAVFITSPHGPLAHGLRQQKVAQQLLWLLITGYVMSFVCL